MIKEGEKVKVDPRLTGLDEWIEGTVIDIEHNPFKGLVIAIRDKFNRIFFGEQKYFIPVNEGSVYLTEKTDMANLFRAIDALKRIPWFQASVRDLRAFRVEDWSNFTDFIKENK